MERDKSFSQFGKTFQEDLCHLILNDRPFADQMFEVLDLKFLEQLKSSIPEIVFIYSQNSAKSIGPTPFWEDFPVPLSSSAVQLKVTFPK